MSKAEKKKKESPSMGAWQKLDNRLAAMEDLIHKKKANLLQLDAEYTASTDEQEKRYMATSIKAARLDLHKLLRGAHGGQCSHQVSCRGGIRKCDLGGGRGGVGQPEGEDHQGVWGGDFYQERS